MNQSGVKHAATEPTRLDNKRERRRGAAGRAAALRRAPSDSDCSGETASLSADSGDRVVRPAPQPPPRGKSRSRRRGSEWEVLEGLKDGQRFEKRPDVFNGYLHKKRKWPLKGWHKRFFVIDGGILVYARSPTDVARGRLHGSVDVGLSVISAKARRRRIDIDADEFIYHLRAKTPEVFRTWLNILKTHRLYRQHLLTFGARESVPKIHAPLDDLPPTDTSSRTSLTSIETSTMSSSGDYSKSSNQFPDYARNTYQFESSIYDNIVQKSIQSWRCNSSSKSDLIPLNFESLDEQKIFDGNFNNAIFNKSLCSMNCARLVRDLTSDKSEKVSQGSTDGEKQMHSTDLDINSFRSTEPCANTSRICNFLFNSTYITDNPVKTIEFFTRSYQNLTSSESNEHTKMIRSLNTENKVQPTTAYFFFTRKKYYSQSVDSPMRRSKKSTNLVKYKNLVEEPTLKRPLSKCMLLGKYKVKMTKQIDIDKSKNRAVACDTTPKENSEAQVQSEDKEHKASQDVMTASDYDKITERLMVSIFAAHSNTDNGDEVKNYINQVIKDLYDKKYPHHIHPVKALFRSLLEYWLKNTSVTSFKDAMTCVKSINRQSNRHFTKDENLSSVVITKYSKETQFYGVSDVTAERKADKGNNTHKQVNKNNNDKRDPPKSHSPKRDTESFEKERRIQELEKLLKNTIYICETGRNQSRNKDIKITKTLIDNLGKLSVKSDLNKSSDNVNSNSSTELTKIQETINQLISETSVPPDIAKEFLSVYLDVLIHDSSKSTTNTSSQSNDEFEKANIACDVQTESVIKKLSKSVTTLIPPVNKTAGENCLKEKANSVDPGQMYLKDVLDRITTIFSKPKKVDDNWQNITNHNIDAINNKFNFKDELGRSAKEYPGKNLIHETSDHNTVVIDLSKYDLEHVSMFSDPTIKGTMSITIKLKEKPSNFGESKHTHLSLKFSDNRKLSDSNNDHWLSFLSRKNISDNVFSKVPIDAINDNLSDDLRPKGFIDLKPYTSNSGATSKAYRVIHESEHSFDLSFKSSDLVRNDLDKNEDLQSCFIMSSLKNNTLAMKFQSKKKVRLKECNGSILSSKTNFADRIFTRHTPQGLSIVEQPSPKIIDEKFLLLLLENLTLLSKSVPSLHKDINNVYVKLKKKYDKVARNSTHVQGLSLLGKIYNEKPSKTDENETQFDVDICPQNNGIVKETLNTGINTTINKLVDENTGIESVTAFIVHKVVKNIEVQTEEKYKEVQSYIDEDKASTSKSLNFTTNITQTTSVKYISCDEIQTTECATSNPNWLKHTKERAMSTVIKYILDNDSTENFRITQPMRHIKVEREVLKKCKKQSLKLRQDLIKEISLLSPSFKVSTQSQTDGKIIKITDEKEDFKIYQLFLSNKYELTRTSSMTDSNVEVTKSDELKTLYRCSSDPSYCSGLISPTAIRGPQFVSGTPGGRLASWIIESGGPLENASREVGQAQLSVQQLQRLLDALELQQQVHHDTDVSIEGASPNVKKDRRKFGLRKKKSNSKCASVELAPPHIDPSNSHMALSALTAPPSPGGGASSIPNSAASLPIACAAARPQSLPSAEAFGPAAGPASLCSLTPDHQLREDFTVLAKDLLASLKTIVATLVCERGRLRAAMEAAEPAGTPGGSVVTALRTNLTSALQQNSELRSRLSRIHLASDIAEISSLGASSDQANRQFQQSLSYSSSCVSASEFFDAEEHEEDDLKVEEVIPADEAGVIELDGDSSSEAGSLSSEEGSASSDNSDGAMLSAEQETLRLDTNGASPRPASGWSRRSRLPSPRPTPGGPSLWNLLYKNIGKDLSQISMPVTINEPLNMLQRLCEELEYSELLDSAAECVNAMERMALVAAFAVSAYASSAHRAASKPFNPLLAETYECVRDDRGFHFIAEQVSHHPPISACHAESPRWCFWQEARIKTKFWGKSMEFQPTGRVHVRLTSTGDHYSWNKVTTCVHNLFGGQRWVDQYGDMHITCHGTDISCKLNFVKASSWSSSRHEVRGQVTGGGARLRLAGRWSEALYAGEPPHTAARCLWRPGAMPPDHELYYGFTRFAMELNELEPGLKEVLPHTDTRLRPDQRALEEGDVESAEMWKHQLEQAQRERRRDRPEHVPAWFCKISESGEETWVFSGEYWKAREAGFPDNTAPRIW